MTASRPGRRVVLLDLDGTLTASHPGIIACVRKTFEELGHPVPDEAELRRFIGPSIGESLRRNHVPEDEIEEGIRIYRHYYSDVPAFDDPNQPGGKVPGRLVNTVFPGIPDQLRMLRADGCFLAVATCKPEYQALPVCDHFGLTDLVDGVYGASKDSSRLDKEDVIAWAFSHIGFNSDDGDRALMVGDRWTDAEGAAKMGLDCLGCGWGYADEGELLDHGCYRIIDRVDLLSGAVEEYFEGRG
ncbi:HAD hydrolase-like protein [Bifidobacterium favimelis]|uniref:HAD hydrolase-like protein n=1 Tax=Bifidobacterium favimelis TaxID=3122979 RepID=A0ABU8ZN51_9BIFI